MRGISFSIFTIKVSVSLAPLLSLALANTPTYPHIQSQEFDNGEFGLYPNQTYRTRPDLISPQLNVLRHDPRCDSPLYTLISLRGDMVELKGQSPMIFDSSGNLVWMNATYGETFGLNVQTYNGKEYLTFWQGDDSVGGHGSGVYILLDENYNEAYRLTAGDSKDGDLHEFHITPQNTALVTQYILKEQPIMYRHRSRNGWIWDSVLQEIDIATNSILFEWFASDHFSTEESYYPAGTAGLRRSHAYDFFHINSIDKDPSGNYLISSRYMNSVSYIDGKTGDVLWSLGGRRNNFTDLSEGSEFGSAVQFQFQHDARWTADYSGITLFDNGARYGLKPNVESSRAVHVKLDREAMTAETVRSYVNPRKIISASQGSVQVLSDTGNVLVGYGYNAAWTEFTAEGEALCDVHVGTEKGFGTGAVQTYKVVKKGWVGKPTTKPDVKVVRERVWVSWNGATEVRTWRIEGKKEIEGDEWRLLRDVQKIGFETGIKFQYDVWCWVRLVALDEKGAVLETSDAAKTGTECGHTVDESKSIVDMTSDSTTEEPVDTDSSLHASIPSTGALKFIVFLGFSFGVFELLRRKVWKRSMFGPSYRALPGGSGGST
ncbi:arylsulfotransferase protein [Rutstroemia sp. NJR-2017a WRK4]|nr:arylsulfotransferase protein [Rutstroemia sp. NJR-2017a WRK4]